MESVFNDYGRLLDRFIQREMSADDFQSAYLRRFKNETRKLDEAVFAVLDSLFGDVDAFCEDPRIRADLNAQTPGFYLGEDELRQRVLLASERLRDLHRASWERDRNQP